MSYYRELYSDVSVLGTWCHFSRWRRVREAAINSAVGDHARKVHVSKSVPEGRMTCIELYTQVSSAQAHTPRKAFPQVDHISRFYYASGSHASTNAYSPQDALESC